MPGTLFWDYSIPTRWGLCTRHFRATDGIWLPFTREHLPDLHALDNTLMALTGWRTADMGPIDRYITSDEWFVHFAEKKFPVPYYMRPPHELEFATRGDMFHECYCHLPFFTDQAFADTASLFSSLYTAANEQQRADIARIWWFTAEFALVKERGYYRRSLNELVPLRLKPLVCPLISRLR